MMDDPLDYDEVDELSLTYEVGEDLVEEFREEGENNETHGEEEEHLQQEGSSGQQNNLLANNCELNSDPLSENILYDSIDWELLDTHISPLYGDDFTAIQCPSQVSYKYYTNNILNILADI